MPEEFQGNQIVPKDWADGRRDGNAQPDAYGEIKIGEPTGPDYTFNVNDPLVPKAGADNKGNTAVNTNAMLVFANNIEQLIEPVKAAHQAVSAVDVRAGAFNRAYVLRNSISGDNQLTDSTLTVLNRVQEGLVDLAAAARKLAADYENTEELSKATTDDVGRYMTEVGADVRGLAT